MEGVIQDLENTETITISLEDAAQIILQEQGIPMDGSGTVHIPPGTYHILTQEGAQISTDGTLMSEGGAMDAVGITVIQSGDDIVGYGTETSGSGELVSGDEAIQVQAIGNGTDLEQQNGTIQLINIQQSHMEGGEQVYQVYNPNEEQPIVTETQFLHPTSIVTQAQVLRSEANLLGSSTIVTQVQALQSEANLLQPSSMVTQAQVLQSETNILESATTVAEANGQQSSGIVTEANGQQSSGIVTEANGQQSSGIVTEVHTLPPTVQQTLQTVQTADKQPNQISLLQQSVQPQVVLENLENEDTSEPQEIHSVQVSALLEGSEVTQNSEVSQMSEVEPTVSAPSANIYIEPLQADGTPTEAIQTDVEPQSKDDGKQLDLSKPIAVTNSTEVVINGKKCILMANPTTGELCAYPVLPPPGKKKRGRPRKDHKQDGRSDFAKGTLPLIKAMPPQDKDQNSAAEGLLELGNTDPDGIRRSGRVRKQASALNDYEVLELSGDSGEEDEESEMKKQKIDDKNYVPLTPYLMPTTGVKRGRGRPRRYPPPGQVNSNTQIPAVIIPGANGQTIMMAPIQGLSNLQAFQEQVRSLPNLVARPEEVGDEENSSQEVILNESDLSLDTEDSTLADVAASAEAGVTLSIARSEASGKSGGLEGADQQTIIQIPENLLSMFLPKKDPVKIGLKASESDLEKMKCSKCDFQAYYLQQYQTHIASHTDDVHKCKCCHYVTFDMNDLLAHFKENHPRCICTECEFMAEHAYIIKRHMMRHSANGCTCDLCGRVYKDHYILKMHIKMVHMPAEILFECTVCSKKFTRKAHLKRHLRIHEPEKPFKCPHCDYRGCERSDISKHLLIHEEPKHLCEVCNKAFRHMKNKELHLKRHNGQRDYKCGVCDFYGYTFTDIRKHIERKHADIKTLVCDKCGSAFKSESFLREHQKQQCEVFMIEQALAIANSGGGTSQATIQIPSSSFTVDGSQILIDGQQIVTEGGEHVNITVKRISMPDEDEENVMLTEVTGEQLQGNLDVSHISVSHGQVITGEELDGDYIEGVEEISREGVEEIPREGEEEEITIEELRVGAITVDGGQVIEAHEVERLVESELEEAAMDISQEVEEEEEEELSIAMV
ncbi:uncharacterized protein LOC110454762 isoform X1 [Mizuhopecten yessoensis]|uniref:uncharacterized protein LOC110454762 isoform X1 n=1 Tax=Mizuhopecten yessoensis TaxID=6573 RepID=UPI000B45EC44|nr:uncharacterized protein LOC110454762 isoform X1 [Mizuhopecten yessoensis]XP_021360124.1 uncharacterized protein LOC110454762 isoform X1 [Mizuhopecten yessoensis]XP_021360125.1 uncharacterized protein LOC110454762 isoform X1 [Mizuhopecten yessoensis]XP_021360126.1 uncharacterized protein LOC110454762 isoform X1 [Mizuhopecten yessoensis]XP_021360128.1 uncharacterized protein LOC110454762 isoform X1 [Mizuhopecten yessoensis]XP_021360129.1 uncharacterized protein LOC110454762 isoform X1 [Mizuho